MATEQNPFDPEDTDWGRNHDRRAATTERHHRENLQTIGEIKEEVNNMKQAISEMNRRMDAVVIENTTHALAIAENTRLTVTYGRSTEWIRAAMLSMETAVGAISKVCNALIWLGHWIKRLALPLIYIGAVVWVGVSLWKGHGMRETIDEFLNLVRPK